MAGRRLKNGGTSGLQGQNAVRKYGRARQYPRPTESATEKIPPIKVRVKW